MVKILLLLLLSSSASFFILFQMRISKEDVGFDIVLLEQAAILATEENKMASEMTAGIQHLNIETNHHIDLAKQIDTLSVRDEQKMEGSGSVSYNLHISNTSDSENGIKQDDNIQHVEADSHATDTNSSVAESDASQSESDRSSDEARSVSVNSVLDSDDTVSDSVGTDVDDTGCDVSLEQVCLGDNTKCKASNTRPITHGQVDNKNIKTVVNETHTSKDKTTLNF